MVSLSSSEWNILNSGLSGNKSWITTTAMKVPIQQCHCSWVYSSLQLVPLFRNIKIHWKHMPAISSDWNKCGTSLHRLHQPLPRLWICGWSEKNIFVVVWELQEVNAHRGFTVGHLPLVNLQKSGTRSPQIQKCRHSSRTQSAPNEQTNSGRLFVAPGKVVSAFLLLSACDPLSWMAKTYMNQAVLLGFNIGGVKQVSNKMELTIRRRAQDAARCNKVWTKIDFQNPLQLASLLPK